MNRIPTLLLLLIFCSAQSQTILQPGFDPKEYAQLLSLTFNSSGIPDSVERKTSKDPYHLEYRSAEVGLLNRWTFYLRNDNTAVIDLRGTVNKTTSWLANFYAAMIPATGSLQLNDSTTFNYQFAANEKAAVHAGWTISIGHLAPEIIKRINEYYSTKKVKEFLVMGHSQGGALAFLLRSYLFYETLKGNLPKDITYKTYCSAAPKVGNMYYAYDFDFITRGGWAHTVVNAADWVPETPFSVQTVYDFNRTSPLTNAKAILKKQKFAIRIAGGIVYDKLERKPRKAQRKFEKYLGTVMYKKAIRKVLPQLKEPVYVHDNNFMRAGNPVILMPDAGYFQLFPDDKTKPFIHHMFAPYYALVKKLYLTR
ncbi:MAG: lipase family protein [Chitinophagales bacterium]|nr:lipase family protein [Chitinophagales bacterium]